MPTTAWLGASVVAQDTTDYPYTGWNSVSNAQGSSNSTYASGVPSTFGGTFYDDHVRLVLAGIVQTDVNKANGQFLNANVDKDLTYGGAADTWGKTLTPADINSTTFGASWRDSSNCALKGTGYGFAIPTYAIITGVELRVRAKRPSGPSYSYVAVDSLEMRVTYVTDYTLLGFGRGNGFVLGGEDDSQVKLDKRYQYKVYDKGQFLGEWDEVATEPNFKEQINTLGTTMPITLGRNLDNLDPIPYGITDESGDDFLSEDGDTLIGLFNSGNGLGAGSDADVNFDVNVSAYYGGYDYLITQDGDELVTEDFELLYVLDGAPEGRSLFKGFISKWLTNYGGSEAIDATLMSNGWELNQYILETADTLRTNNPVGSGSWGVSGNSLDDTNEVRQSFTASATFEMSRIALNLALGNAVMQPSAVVTLDLYTGSSLTAGTLIASSQVTVDSATPRDYNFYFSDYLPLVNGTSYHIRVRSSEQKISSSWPYPVLIAIGSSYGGGSMAIVTNGSTVTAQTDDLAFKTYEAGGETTVPFNSYDPAQILREVIDGIQARGSVITYSDESIVDTGTVVSYTFNTNTAAEAINKVLELCPPDWYFYLDVATNEVYLQPRPIETDHIFTLGRDVTEFEIERNMEDITNEAYFSGGGDPALFVKTTDQDSLNTWRRGLVKLSDNRVTDAASATIINQGKIDRNKDPQYTVKLTIPAAAYDIETVRIGQLAGFRAFNNFIDDLELQVVEKTYSRDIATLTLGTLRPAVSKRLEDLRRNLDTLEQQNNPSAPL